MLACGLITLSAYCRCLNVLASLLSSPNSSLFNLGFQQQSFFVAMDSGHATFCQLLNLTLSYLPTVIQVDIFLYLISLLTNTYILRTDFSGVLLKLVLGLLLILIFINDLEKGNGCELAGITNQAKLQGRREVEEATTEHRWGSICPVAKWICGKQNIIEDLVKSPVHPAKMIKK